MELIIKDSSKLLQGHFSTWLLDRIKESLIQNIDERKARNWDEYLNSENKFKSIYLKKLKAVDMLLIGINNIVLTTTQDKLVYHIDNNQYVPGLDRVKVLDMCKLINYGTLSHPAYPLFTTTFEEIKTHLEEYIDEYLYTVG